MSDDICDNCLFIFLTSVKRNIHTVTLKIRDRIKRG